MTYYGFTSSEMGGFLSLLGVAFLAFAAFLLAANWKAYRKSGPMPNKSLERTREKIKCQAHTSARAPLRLNR